MNNKLLVAGIVYYLCITTSFVLLEIMSICN